MNEKKNTVKANKNVINVKEIEEKAIKKFVDSILESKIPVKTVKDNKYVEAVEVSVIVNMLEGKGN